MQKNFTLSVPNRCSEKWDHLAPTDKGGYCSTCEKMVIDFTKMTDDEIVNFFKRNSAHVCGRFQPQQLKAYTQMKLNVKPGFPLLKAAVVSALLVLSAKHSYGQAPNVNERGKVVRESKKSHRQKVVEPQEQVVRGIVIDPIDKYAMPGVNVLQKGTTNGTVTDAEGKFKFPTRVKAGDVLVFSFIGYETQEYVIPPSRDTKVEMCLSLNLDVSIMGEVATNDIYHEEGSSSSRLWSKIKSIF